MEGKRVLVVDDEEGLRTYLRKALTQQQYEVSLAADGVQGLQMARDGYRAILLDLNLPGKMGMEVLQYLNAHCPDSRVIVITGNPSPQAAFDAMALGAWDYLTKPFNLTDLEEMLRRVFDEDAPSRLFHGLRRLLREEYGFEGIIGDSPAVQKAYVTASRVAPCSSAVLILGETGTGKEYLARAIHMLSRQRQGPFVTVNCGGLPDTTFEVEMFGSVKGAFTDARDRAGYFETANTGTLFLDEVGDLSPASQVKMLRVLQDKTFQRLGSSRAQQADFRIVAATNRDLDTMMERDEYRRDLYYRLRVIPLYLPPLRERREDLAKFIWHFIEKYNRAHQRSVKRISPQAEELLLSYPWPGNIRELENCIDGAVANTLGELIIPEVLELSTRAVPAADLPAPDPLSCLEDVERWHIARVLARMNCNVSQAATLLKIDRTTLRARARRYGLLPDPEATLPALAAEESNIGRPLPQS